MHNFHKLSKPELEYLRENCNFTTDETKVIDYLCSGKSYMEISLKMNCSIATISRKVRTIKDKVERSESMDKKKIPTWEKLNLTVEEAAEYSGIGINKLYDMIKSPSCTYTLFVGKRTLIKRKAFEKYLEDVDEV
jgi:excisionase family DNA binding protein